MRGIHVPTNPQQLEAEATQTLMLAGFAENGLPTAPTESVEGYYPTIPIHSVDRQIADPNGLAFLTPATPSQK